MLSKMKSWLIDRLVVTPDWSNRSTGRLLAGGIVIRCALGRSGLVTMKREGDRGTPIGVFALTSGFVRRDRLSPDRSGIPLRATRVLDGWCDDPRSGAYNRYLRLPVTAGHERLWRKDRLYDVVLVLDHNHSPRQKGGGSAIFFHLADGGYGPTAGCVAISLADMRRLLPRLSRKTLISIQRTGGSARAKNG